MRNLLPAILFGVAALLFGAPARAADSDNLRIAKALSDAYAEVVDKIAPSVVTINTEKKVAEEESEDILPPGLPPQFREFFRRRSTPPRQYRSQGIGSGFIVSADGLILTNNHVVENAGNINVTLADGAEFRAELVGADPKTDVAIIRLKDAAARLTPIALGDSDKVKPGNIVIAVGAPFGLKQTVTCGIVSATNRNKLGGGELRSIMYQDFIQTDATINLGNSGGPLVNLDGEAIGINSAISSASGGSDGIGFSIPINMVKSIKDELVQSGSITRGYLGVGIRDLDATMKKALPDVKSGAYVLQTYPNTPASEAGMQVGDIIVKFDGAAINDTAHLQALVAKTPVGKKVPVEILRGDKTETLTVTIKKQPRVLTGDAEKGDEPEAEVETTDKYHSEILGLTVAPLTAGNAEEKEIYADAKGVLVVKVDDDGAADRANLQRGMLVVLLNQKPVTSIDEFKQIEQTLRDKKSAVLLCRFGKNNDVVTLEFDAAKKEEGKK
ncbi:MAG: Do family serine endopeptidase [Planctomycetota bacterium]|jgi:serine protease Do|nr:Do family serine endopeptidase [Planctomycetota bacterium]